MLKHHRKPGGHPSLLQTYAASLGAQIDRRRSELSLIAARREAEMASRAKSEFLANMSHELRTPLNAILGFSDIIRDARFGEGEEPWRRYRDYASDINDASSHLLAVVNDILDMSRIESGRMELELDEVSVAHLVKSIATMLADRAASAGLTLKVDIADGLPLVEADERRLKQALLNLAANAVKFTPEGGTVTLIAKKAALGLSLAVQDTGRGMTPEQIRIAMEPFRQVDGGLARVEEGTGLGLPLAKAFAELHGASFSVNSTPGEGTLVEIRFPITRIRRASSPDGNALSQADAS